MRGRLAVLIAAALLTLLPVNSPGVSEAGGAAPNFDIYFGPSGDSDISLIQTDKGNVFRGTARRRPH